MALSDAQAYEGDGSTRDFSILGEIPSESHLRVWIDDVLQSSDSWDLLGNTVLFDEAPTDGASIQFIVSTTGTDFPTSPSDISKVAANIGKVVNVSDNMDSVKGASDFVYRTDVVISVDTIEDMLLLTPIDGNTVIVKDINRGGTFIYDATQSAVNNGGTIFNGWVRQYSGAVNVKWFGAVGDGATDDTAAIQLAIDLCLRHKKNHEVKLDSGTFIISDTIHIGYGNAAASLDLDGSGLSYKGEAQFAGTIIKPTFTDRPIISCTWVRNVKISNMSILGSFQSWMQTKNLGNESCLVDDTDIEEWKDPSASVNAYSETAPFAAIAVDPYGGTAPTIAYPDVNFPSWTGLTAQYGKNKSARVKLEYVEIYGVAVGVAVSPCLNTDNSEFVALEKVVMGWTVWGMSVGNHQNRGFNLTDCQITDTFIALTTVAHGAKQGSCKGVSYAVNFDRTIQMFDFSTVYGAYKFDSCSGEQLYKIGSLGAGASNKNPVIFDNCALNFGSQGNAQRGVPNYIIDGEAAHVHFSGGHFTGFYNNSNFVRINSSLSVSTDNLSIQKFNMPTTTARALAENTTMGGLLASSESYADCKVSHLINRTDTFAGVDIFLKKNEFTTSEARYYHNLPQRARITGYDYGNFEHIQRKQFVNTSSWTSIIVTGLDVSVDIGTSDVGRARQRIDIGDIIYDGHNSVYYVKSRTGTVIVMEAVTDYKGTTINTPFVASGDLVVLHSRAYFLNQEHRFVFTAGSAIANVRRVGDSYSGLLSSSFTVGDRIIPDIDLSGVFHINDNQKIVSINDAAGTITFERTARDSATGFVRMASRTFNS